MNKIKIYQLYFDDKLREFLENEFIPHYTGNYPNPELREFRVMYSYFISGQYKEADYVGFMSWKFHQKTGIRGEDFINFFNKNPGFDVYFINPFWDQLLWKNVWVQGDFCHPGILYFTQNIFDKLGYQIDLTKIQNTSENLCFSNFWIGSSSFWEAYMKFAAPIYEYLTVKASAEEKKFLELPADREIKCGLVPFIMERVFSTFISLNPNWKAKGFEFSQTELDKKYPNAYLSIAVSGVLLKENGEIQEAIDKLQFAYAHLHAIYNQSSTPLQPKGIYMNLATNIYNQLLKIKPLLRFWYYIKSFLFNK